MSFSPLTPVTDYQSMLNRIFWFTTGAALVAVWMLRLYVPGLDGLLSRIDVTVDMGGNKILPMPGGYLIPALAVGMLTRVYHLHARISDWLGIRECFDVDIIIRELAERSGIDLNPIAREDLVRKRHQIMRTAFYPFVSGPEPQVDSQLVEQALDAWSWFWVGVEATFVFVLAGFALISGGAFQVGYLWVGGALVVAAIGLPAMRGQCRRYAIAQVRAILADPTRANAVRSAFVELTTGKISPRRAA
jgi:hypothetical protein